MVERRKQPRFPLEADPVFFTFQGLFRQDLDRDLAAETRVPRPVNLPHPSRAEGRKDFVRTEAGSGRKSHGRLFPVVESFAILVPRRRT